MNTKPQKSWWKRNNKMIVNGSIYVAIAVITSVMSNTSTPVMEGTWGMVLAGTLQGLNALKGFADQSVAWNEIDNKDE